MAKKGEGKKEENAIVEEGEAVEEGAEAVEEAGEQKQAPEPTPLEKAQALAEDYKRKWYSVSADYDNYRKRNQAAVSKAYADGMAEALLKLLPVADNFGYAYASVSDEKSKVGIEKIIKNFNAIIESMGVKEIEVKEGDPFDETIMEAVLSCPAGEGEKVNVVKNVLKKGYKSGDKVIRYVQVAVTTEE